jgi:hypothetical protein
MLRVRIALIGQTLLAVLCILGVINFADTRRHPVGTMYTIYDHCPLLSFVLFVWVTIELLMSRTQPWRHGVVFFASLLLALLVWMSANLMLIGE